MRSQGRGVKDFSREKIGNVWLKKYNLFKPSRFIEALRLRTNTFGTRNALARADKMIYVACRSCRAQPETLGHILGLCQYTRSLRIRRHDVVKSDLANKLSTNNEVFVEPTIKVGGNLYKPHFENEKRILVEISSLKRRRRKPTHTFHA